MPSGTSMRYGNSLKPRDSGIGGNLKMTSPATCCFHRPAVDADGILERGAAEHVLARQHVTADHAPGLADAELRRQVDDVGFFEARHRAQEFERLHRLPAALDLAAASVCRDRSR